MLTLVGGKGGGLSTHERGDEYYTPREALDVLLPYLPRRTIWEMASGAHGHKRGLPRHLRQAGFKVVGSAKLDGLTCEAPQFDLIVTNPPYSLKDEFLARAYFIGKPFAMLLPVDALGGQAAASSSPAMESSY